MEKLLLKTQVSLTSFLHSEVNQIIHKSDMLIPRPPRRSLLQNIPGLNPKSFISACVVRTYELLKAICPLDEDVKPGSPLDTFEYANAWENYLFKYCTNRSVRCKLGLRQLNFKN